jgi:hypothetical protein
MSWFGWFFSGFPSGHSWILDGRRARCGWLASHPGTCLERKPGNTLVYSKPLRNVRRHVKTFHFLIVIKYLYYLYSSGLHWVTNHEKNIRFEGSAVLTHLQSFPKVNTSMLLLSCLSFTLVLLSEFVSEHRTSPIKLLLSRPITAWPSNSHISPKFHQIPIFSPCMIIIDRIWPYKSS